MKTSHDKATTGRWQPTPPPCEPGQEVWYAYWSKTFGRWCGPARLLGGIDPCAGWLFWSVPYTPPPLPTEEPKS